MLPLPRHPTEWKPKMIPDLRCRFRFRSSIHPRPHPGQVPERALILPWRPFYHHLSHSHQSEHKSTHNTLRYKAKRKSATYPPPFPFREGERKRNFPFRHIQRIFFPSTTLKDFFFFSNTLKGFFCSQFLLRDFFFFPFPFPFPFPYLDWKIPYKAFNKQNSTYVR